MGDSEKDTNNNQGNSANSKDHNRNDDDKPQEYGSSNIENSGDNPSENEIISEVENPKNTESSKQKTEDSVKNENKSDKQDISNEYDEDNAYHIPVKLENNFIKLIKTKRDKITKGSALIVGGVLILYGLVLISSSVTKVASNVIFGEDATADAFLMLLGVLIIVAAFAQSIMDKTSLGRISSELEDNDKSSESDDNSRKVKENDNKVNDDNKDNILGENKR